MTAPSLPPLLAGRYVPEAPLGRGAIAEVWRARDRATGTTVALKLLHEELRESAAVVERFRREVDLVRRIRHPHVLLIHDLVEDSGHLCLVMEHCPGGDLAALLARGPLGIAHLDALVAEVGGALAAAHAAGIVHRDVKPSNILLAADGLRLGDFGLARTADFSGLTTQATVLGTPEYMAPEVITDGHTDPRSDVYSLGVVLFEAATGRPPFVADSPYQLMRQHVDAAPPPLATLAPHLPAPVVATILRALAKDPLDRFARVEDLMAAWREPTPPAIDTRPSARPRCASCGGWWVREVAICVACGHRGTRLEYAAEKRDARTVLVTGPGDVGTVVSARVHHALDQLASELAGTLPIAGKKKRTRTAPRVPFRFCQGLTESSAHAVAERLRVLGLAVTVTGPGKEERRLLKKKRNHMARRYALGGGTGAFILSSQAHVLFPSSIQKHVLVVGIVLMSVIGFWIPVVRALRSAYRPLLPTPGGGRNPFPVLARLRATLLALVSRQDRRVVARIADRAEHLPEHAEALEPVVLRAAVIAEALGAIDQVSVPSEGAAHAAAALAHLRRAERDRVLLRGALLGLVSRLDAVVMKLARAQLPDARDAAAAVAAALSDLSLEVQGSEEVERLLLPALGGTS